MKRRDVLAGLLAATTASVLRAAQPDKVCALARNLSVNLAPLFGSLRAKENIGSGLVQLCKPFAQTLDLVGGVLAKREVHGPSAVVFSNMSS
jgi:hypothetical protein